MKELHDYLELLYFVSGPFVAFAAIIGYRQLKVAKDTLSLNSARDAIKLSAEQCRHYMNTIIPKITAFNDEVIRLKLARYDNPAYEIKGDQVSVVALPIPLEQAKLITPLQLQVLNELEVFSTYFTARIADEQIAYLTVGTTFCNSVRDLLPDIIFHNEIGHHMNITKLFILWQLRTNANRLNKEKETIEAKLKANNPPASIKPIGSS